MSKRLDLQALNVALYAPALALPLFAGYKWWNRSDDLVTQIFIVTMVAVLEIVVVFGLVAAMSAWRTSKIRGSLAFALTLLVAAGSGAVLWQPIESVISTVTKPPAIADDREWKAELAIVTRKLKPLLEQPDWTTTEGVKRVQGALVGAQCVPAKGGVDGRAGSATAEAYSDCVRGLEREKLALGNFISGNDQAKQQRLMHQVVVTTVTAVLMVLSVFGRGVFLGRLHGDDPHSGTAQENSNRSNVVQMAFPYGTPAELLPEAPAGQQWIHERPNSHRKEGRVYLRPIQARTA